MNFVKKIKDILFEEEDVTTEIDTVEKPTSEPKIVKIESLKNDDFDFIKDEEEVEEKEEKVIPQVEKVEETPKEKDNSFLFPDFDEEEFTSSVSRARQNVNVLDHERKKTEEKRPDYSRYERPDSTVREYDRKKFKPSPIISPVYGILNQDYKAEDIVNRGDAASNINIDEVRKKAFEPVVEEEAPKHASEDVIDEPVVTFFEEKKEEVVDDKEDFKSVDDLLDDASTEVSLEDTLEVPTTSNLDAIEEELEKLDEEEKKEPIKEEKEEDLDNDLFELIDSMYDDRGEV